MQFGFLVFNKKTKEIFKIIHNLSQGVVLSKYVGSGNNHIFLPLESDKHVDYYFDIYGRFSKDSDLVLADEGSYEDCLQRLLCLRELAY